MKGRANSNTTETTFYKLDSVVAYVSSVRDYNSDTYKFTNCYFITMMQAQIKLCNLHTRCACKLYKILSELIINVECISDYNRTCSGIMYINQNKSLR